MATIEVSKHTTLPIVLVYAPPFVNWDGNGTRIANEIMDLLEQAKQPMYVLADLSASTPTLLQISAAAMRHTRSNWIRHPNLAGVLVVSQDPAVRDKIRTGLFGVTTILIRFFADRASALRSIGVNAAV